MMKNDAFERVLEHITQAEIARHFKISGSAVSQWLVKGVPPERAVEIEHLVQHKVSKEELCPWFQWK